MGLASFLFGVKGRLDRTGYGLAMLGWFVGMIVVQRFVVGFPDFETSGRVIQMVLDGDIAGPRALDDAIEAAGHFEVRSVALVATVVLAFLSFLALTARRLHDIGRPAGYAWIAVLPFVGPFSVFFVLLFLPGDADVNRYDRVADATDQPPA
jgi:uncharacterized membrane protein YhaH (DUF805 family)